MDLISWYLFYNLLNSKFDTTFSNLSVNKIFVAAVVISINAADENQPQLTQTHVDEHTIRLQCVADNYQPKLKMYLHCQLDNSTSTDNRCFENCVSYQPSMIVNCSIVIKLNKIIVTYEFLQSSLSTGKYYCIYRGLESYYVSYTGIKSQSPRTKLEFPTTTEIQITNQTKKSLVKMDLILVLLGVFVLSCLVNIAFIIRCCAVRSYLAKYPPASSLKTKTVNKWSWVTCFCLKEEIEATNMYYKTKDDPYEKIRDRASSETSKSKSSFTNEYLNRPISQDTERMCFSSTTSQLSKSSTFPTRHSVLVHTPTDQFSLSALPGNVIETFQPFMVQYVMDSQSQTMKPIFHQTRRLSSHCIYDEVPGDSVHMNPSSNMPIRQFASTGSLYNRARSTANPNLKVSPLPEESQLNFPKFLKDPAVNDEEQGLMMNECSSVLQDFSGSEETYLSGKESDSMRDPVRVAKLEMSREMMAKADTLLREAHNLLKMS